MRGLDKVVGQFAPGGPHVHIKKWQMGPFEGGPGDKDNNEDRVHELVRPIRLSLQSSPNHISQCRQVSIETLWR